jgi:hypothetical protein
VTGITGSSIDIRRRDGASATIVTTGATAFVHNGQPATLADFQTGDVVMARGSQNGNGAFVADFVRGRTPRPRDPDHHAGGTVVSVDTGAGSITVSNDHGTQVILTTPDTRIRRNRQPATLADFVTGDRLRAHGERDGSGNLVADRIMGGDGSGHLH